MSEAPRIHFCGNCGKYSAEWETEKKHGGLVCSCGSFADHEKSLWYQLDEIRERLKRLEKSGG